MSASLAPADRASSRVPSRSVPFRSAVAGDLLAAGTRLALSTIRCSAVGVPRVRACKRRGRPVIFVGWHGHDFLSLATYLPAFGSEARGVIMVPPTARGMSLERFADRMGYEVIRLPADDAPASHMTRAIATMARLIREGRDGLIAVDGPSGPAQRVKPGAIVIARRAGAVLVPAGMAASPAFQMRWRWDDHLVPVPGGRAIAYYGKPLDPSGGDVTRAGDDAVMQRLSEELHHAGSRARALCRLARGGWR